MKLRSGKVIGPKVVDTSTKKMDTSTKKKHRLTVKMEIKLYQSGLACFVEHLGLSEDVINDYYFPEYRKNGLDGLKTHLLDDSEAHHKGVYCAECQSIIDDTSPYPYFSQ